MQIHALAAAITLAAVIPSVALAQETCEQRSANRTAGTAIGAVAGALLGSAVAGHGEKGTGVVVGGIGGAVLGNQLARGPRDCDHAYGWYDTEGRWHANGVQQGAATGYIDRGGEWVEGEPRGHYERGVWIANAAPAGWYDAAGQWHASSVDQAVATGYYDRNGSWAEGLPPEDLGPRRLEVAHGIDTFRSLPDDTGFNEFQGTEDHIRREIEDGVSNDLLERGDAADFRERLRRIRTLEARQKAELRAQLDQLDRDVDRTRNEP